MVDMGQCATTLDSQTDAQGAPSRSASVRAGTISRAERQAILLRTVKLDVIPRLRSLVEPAAPAQASTPTPVVTAAQVADLTDLTLRGHDGAVGAFVSDLRAQGIAAEALFLHLLAPAARRLGEWWEQDVCSFVEVTAGMWRLQDALHALGASIVASAPPPSGPRILLVPLPGEQHTFGLSMVHEFFRRAGWNAWTGPVGSRAELATAVRRQWVDVIGFSLGSDERLDVARAEIRAVRLASRNPGLAVLVGGPPFVANPELAAGVGADGTAENGAQAVAAAAALVNARSRRTERRG